MILSFLTEESDITIIIVNSVGIGLGSFLGWYVLDDAFKDEEVILDKEVIERIPPLPFIFAILGLISMMVSLITKEWYGVLNGIFLFLSFSTVLPSLQRSIIIMVLHRLSLLTVTVLFYTFFPCIMSTFLLLIGIVAIIDASYLVIKKKPIGFNLMKDTES